MQVKFSNENHVFLWQNVKRRYAFTTQRKNAKISITYYEYERNYGYERNIGRRTEIKSLHAHR